MSTGIIPPATGFSRPHPLLRGGDAGAAAAARPRALARRHPDRRGQRHGPGHRRAPGAAQRAGARPARAPGPWRADGRAAPRPGPPRTPTHAGRSGAWPGPPRTCCTPRTGPRWPRSWPGSRTSAPWLSDAELGDLACQLARDAADQGPVRMAIVASNQDQLARLASQATAMLSDLGGGLLAQPAWHLRGRQRGRPCHAAAVRHRRPGAGRPGRRPPARGPGPAAGRRCAGWTSSASARTPRSGTASGEIAGLVWAGCLAEDDAVVLHGHPQQDPLRDRPPPTCPRRGDEPRRTRRRPAALTCCARSCAACGSRPRSAA